MQIRLNATSIGDFKSCPQKFRLKHVKRISPVEDADSLRMGTNWHKCHEVFHEIGAKALDASVQGQELNLSSEECVSIGIQGVVAHLNKAYEVRPANKTQLEWGREREVLLRSFIVYTHYWSNDNLTAVATERKFELPLMHPRIGQPVHPKLAVVTGRMDQIVSWNGKVGVLERKSTSQDIAPDAEYWQLLRKNEQVSIYALAFRQSIATNQDGKVIGLLFKDQPPIHIEPSALANIIYDVWRKPQIEPKLLTQGDTKNFLDGYHYFGEKFSAVSRCEVADPSSTDRHVWVDDEEVEVKPGAKGFQIRESVRMFGARLQAELTADPTRYFARQEIARTDQEIAEFEREIFAIYTAMSAFEREDCYYDNPHSCKSPFPCVYIPLCYGPGANNVCAGGEVPNGFKQVQLTLNGEKLV